MAAIRSMRLMCLASSGILALLSAASAQAQESDGGVAIEEVVVTARKVEENLQQVPIAISVATTATLKAANVTDLRSLQYFTPSLNVRIGTTDSSGSTLIIRGQGGPETLLTNDTAVGVYIDGIYLPRGAGLRAILQNANELERIETLRGPQGTLFGRNTTGGALNVITRAPGTSLGGYAEGSAGNYSSVQLTGGMDIPLGHDVALRVAGMHYVRDGYGHDGLGREVDDFDSNLVRARLTGQVTDRFTFDLSGSQQWSRTNGVALKLAELCGQPGVNCPGVTTPNGFLLGGAMSRNLATFSPAVGGYGLPAGCLSAVEGTATCPAGSNASRVIASVNNYLTGVINEDPNDSSAAQNTPSKSNLGYLALTLAYDLADSLQVKSISGYVKTQRNMRTDLDGLTFDAGRTSQFQKDSFASQEFQLLGSGGPLNYVVGLYASREKGRDVGVSSFFNVVPTFNDGSVRNVSKAAFAQANWGVTDQLTITGGIRYTKEDRRLWSRNRIGGTFDDIPPVVGTIPAAVLVNGVLVPSPNPIPGSLPATNANGFPIPATVAPVLDCRVPVSALVVAPTATSPGRCEALFKARYSNTSWLISADYKLTRDALVYAKVSTGYRAGSHQTNGNSNPASFIPADPEKALQYEVGVKATFLDGRARVNAAAFYTDYKDIIRSIIAIVPNTTPLQTTSVFQTAAKANIRGGEVEATFIPVHGLTLTSTLGYVHGKYESYPEANLDRSDQPFSIGSGAIPKWTYSLGARYEHPTPFGRWTAAATYSYRGKTFAFPQPLTPNPAPGAPIVVASADLAETFGGFEDLSGRLSLDVDAWDATFALYGANLTDKRVCLPNTDLVAFGFRNCAAQAPRTYGVAVTKRF